MTTALRNQVKWCIFGAEPKSFATLFNPFRPFSVWYNTRKMNRYVNHQLDERYTTKRGGLVAKKSKTIIDLALNSYIEEKFATKNSAEIDETFRLSAISQMKLFIFSGFDTTATTICYAFLLLSRNPKALAKLREEHDAVLGDRHKTADLLMSEPALLNRLPYTLSVIKETLRLYPVVSAPKGGKPNFTLTDPTTGLQFPTSGFLVWINHHGLHHNPNLWPSVESFIPERFMVTSEADPLHPPKNAWRAFEFGPRACIGTELALAEREWDERNPCAASKVKVVDGERAYQIQLGSAHPSDGFPARIKLA